ncbi:hypothetical protein [Clostridiisalibacter paucivorans]|uniref:hypothetical protein n=1 Tax=Clostridiisalibacter paucivorans TaxID=408753 RepID=UPI000479B121|nr:hypothetical protein [Clostridiisalibacter paucivorans]
MGKVLLTKKNINQYVSKGDEKIYIGKDMILTPGAKDIIRNMGLTIVYGEKPEEKDCDYCFDPEIVKKDILKMLKEDYGISDEVRLNELCNETLNRINKK